MESLPLRALVLAHTETHIERRELGQEAREVAPKMPMTAGWPQAFPSLVLESHRPPVALPGAVSQ